MILLLIVIIIYTLKKPTVSQELKTEEVKRDEPSDPVKSVNIAKVSKPEIQKPELASPEGLNVMIHNQYIDVAWSKVNDSIDYTLYYRREEDSSGDEEIV